MAESINPYVAKVFDMANTLVPAFVSRVSTDSSRTTSDARMVSRLGEQLADNQLNGSGPADPVLASESAPKSLRDTILGESPTPTSGTSSPMSMFDTSGLLLIGVIVAGLILMQKYKS